MKTKSEPRFLTVGEAAELLSVAPNTVRACGAAGKLTEYRHPVNNYRLFKRADVERIVDDIDEIVRHVRFDGWQDTHAGEREVRKVLRKTLFKYKLHQDKELFDKAYGYIREYY